MRSERWPHDTGLIPEVSYHSTGTSLSLTPGTAITTKAKGAAPPPSSLSGRGPTGQLPQRKQMAARRMTTRRPSHWLIPYYRLLLVSTAVPLSSRLFLLVSLDKRPTLGSSHFWCVHASFTCVDQVPLAVIETCPRWAVPAAIWCPCDIPHITLNSLRNSSWLFSFDNEFSAGVLILLKTKLVYQTCYESIHTIRKGKKCIFFKKWKILLVQKILGHGMYGYKLRCDRRVNVDKYLRLSLSSI